MNHLIEKLIKFRDKRNWKQFHTGQNLSQKLMIEAAEVGELFEWGQEPDKNKLVQEIGDVLIIVLYLCEKYNIDPTIAVLETIQKNQLKYPEDYQNQNWRAK